MEEEKKGVQDGAWAPVVNAPEREWRMKRKTRLFGTWMWILHGQAIPKFYFHAFHFSHLSGQEFELFIGLPLEEERGDRSGARPPRQQKVPHGWGEDQRSRNGMNLCLF